MGWGGHLKASGLQHCRSSAPVGLVALGSKVENASLRHNSPPPKQNTTFLIQTPSLHKPWNCKPSSKHDVTRYKVQGLGLRVGKALNNKQQGNVSIKRGVCFARTPAPPSAWRAAQKLTEPCYLKKHVFLLHVGARERLKLPTPNPI